MCKTFPNTLPHVLKRKNSLWALQTRPNKVKLTISGRGHQPKGPKRWRWSQGRKFAPFPTAGWAGWAPVSFQERQHCAKKDEPRTRRALGALNMMCFSVYLRSSLGIARVRPIRNKETTIFLGANIFQARYTDMFWACRKDSNHILCARIFCRGASAALQWRLPLSLTSPQVVMGYGHNKLSLEEAEELLKEVKSPWKRAAMQWGWGGWSWWYFCSGWPRWRWKAGLYRVYANDALGFGRLAQTWSSGYFTKWWALQGLAEGSQLWKVLLLQAIGGSGQSWLLTISSVHNVPNVGRPTVGKSEKQSGEWWHINCYNCLKLSK